ncbi:MAG: ABC transporter substrate-binding protein [Propionibacteriales bacterium]|nr:ABC transporter substrate-binding protein [Propionibacteriales bacterium]
MINNLPATRLGRRGALALGGGLFATLVVAGCGGPSGGQDKAAGDAGMRTVQSFQGPVDVPSAPASIVLVAATHLLELPDVNAVGLTEDPFYQGMTTKELAAKYAAIPKIGTPREIDYEGIAAMAPDVIVVCMPAPGLTDGSGNLERLAEIAPVGAVPPKKPDDRLVQFADLADVINQRAAAEALMARVQQQATEVGKRHAAFLKGKKALAVNSWEQDGTIAIQYAGEWDSTVGAMIGMECIQGGKLGGTYAAEQAVGLLSEADLIVVGGNNTGELAPLPDVKAFLEGKLGQSIPAVKNDRLIQIPSGGDRSWTLAEVVIGVLDERLTQLAAKA